MMAQDEFLTHEQPVWRKQANFIINASLSAPGRFEQLWCRQIGDDQFEVCCIPFFLYDIALGDIVRTAPAEGRAYVLSEVVAPSGRYVFRVWFGQSFQPRDAVTADLEARDALIEWSSRNLLAIDASDALHATEIAEYLQAQEAAGRLMYETGKMS